MFVNRVLLHYENVASFLFDFWDATMLFNTFSSEDSEICHEMVKFWAANATRIFKIFYLLRNADVSKFF